MDFHHGPDPSVSELVQTKREKISGDGLDDVLGEFPTVDLQLTPLASRRDALVSDAGATEPVLT